MEKVEKSSYMTTEEKQETEESVAVNNNKENTGARSVEEVWNSFNKNYKTILK